MKLGIFTPTYPGVSGAGGIGTYTRNLAHALSGLGHRVHVLTVGAAPDTVADGPVTVRVTRDTYFPVVDRLVPGAGASCRVGAALAGMAWRHGLDVVEFPNWGGHGSGFALVRGRRPLVVRLHTSTLESQVIDGDARDRRAAWEVRHERLLCARADVLVTHSEAHRQAMSGELGVPAGRIALVPHGIPVRRDFVRPPRPADPPTVVYLGRLEKRKGTLDLLHALPAVVARVPDVRVVLIGRDRPHCPGGRTHRQYLDEELPPEVRRRVTFAGELPDAEVDRRLQTADVFVAPSLYESFGLIYLEAMRWGTPVIGTTAGGVPEIIGDGESGLLVPPSCPEKLSSALILLLQDEALRRRLGEAGRRRAETTFSIEECARRMAHLYAKALGRAGALAAAAL